MRALSPFFFWCFISQDSQDNLHNYLKVSPKLKSVNGSNYWCLAKEKSLALGWQDGKLICYSCCNKLLHISYFEATQMNHSLILKVKDLKKTLGSKIEIATFFKRNGNINFIYFFELWNLWTISLLYLENLSPETLLCHHIFCLSLLTLNLLPLPVKEPYGNQD